MFDWLSDTVSIRKMTQSSEGVCISVIPAEREKEITHDSISAHYMQPQCCDGLCNRQTHCYLRMYLYNKLSEMCCGQALAH